MSKHQINDEILLNIWAQGKYKKLPSKYNVLVGYDEILFSGIIFHFIGPKKPWNSDYPKGLLWLDWNTNTELIQQKFTFPFVKG